MSGNRFGVHPLAGRVALAGPAAAFFLAVVLFTQNLRSQDADSPLFGPPESPQRQVVTDGPIELSIELSGPSVLIAQPITLRLQVDAPLKTLITLPPIRDTLGGLTVIGSETVADLPLDANANRRRWVTSIQLECFEGGAQTIPPLEVVYRLPEGFFADGTRPREGMLKSKPMSIQIISAVGEQEDPTQFRDIKDVQELPPDLPEGSKLPWLGICGGLAACATIGLVVWSRRNRRLAANRWALDQVERIESQYQHQSFDISQAYGQLSTVIRNYLEAQLTVPATALASTELVSELPPDRCPESAKRRLKQFMMEADELRFSGRLNLDVERVESPFDSIRAIILETSEASGNRENRERS